MDLALGRPTTRYIAYAMHRIRMLQHYGVKPYVVFDGGPLPSKAGTEAERELYVPRADSGGVPSTGSAASRCTHENACPRRARRLCVASISRRTWPMS